MQKMLSTSRPTMGLDFMLAWKKLRVLTKATPNGLAGRVVARGPPVAHPWFRASQLFLMENCCLFYYTVLQSLQLCLVIKKLNADLLPQTDFAISHLYNTKADYSPHSDCSAAKSRSSF